MAADSTIVHWDLCTEYVIVSFLLKNPLGSPQIGTKRHTLKSESNRWYTKRETTINANLPQSLLGLGDFL